MFSGPQLTQDFVHMPEWLFKHPCRTLFSNRTAQFLDLTIRTLDSMLRRVALLKTDTDRDLDQA
jgi:hypothetical protein